MSAMSRRSYMRANRLGSVVLLFLSFYAGAVQLACAETNVAIGDPRASDELNTALMWNTFIIGGPSARPGESGKMRVGTVFLLSKPVNDGAKVIIVTAAHVLEDIGSDIAKLQFRERDQNGDWQPLMINVRIRINGKPRWVRLPDKSIDIAAMPFTIENEIAERVRKNMISIPVDTLAEDSLLEQYNIHPGSTLFCLGFPLRASSNNAGFPVLRSGTISSYPIFPTRKHKGFDFDCEIYEGNSGGPVYIAKDNPMMGNSLVLGKLQTIVGLVTAQKRGRKTEEDKEVEKDINLGVVMPSTLIKDTIDLLPDTN